MAHEFVDQLVLELTKYASASCGASLLEDNRLPFTIHDDVIRVGPRAAGLTNGEYGEGGSGAPNSPPLEPDWCGASGGCRIYELDSERGSACLSTCAASKISWYIKYGIDLDRGLVP